MLLEVLNEFLLLLPLEIEVSLRSCKAILRVLEPLVTHVLLRWELIEANLLSEARMRPILEDPRESLDGDTVLAVDLLDLFIGEPAKHGLSLLWVGIGHVDELHFSTLY